MKRILTLARSITHTPKIKWIRLRILLTLVLTVCWFTFSIVQPSIEEQNNQVIWQGEIVTPANERFVVEKILGSEGNESTVFIDEQGKMYTKAEFYARLASQEPKIDSELSGMLTSGDQNEIVPLIVVLKEQPQAQKSDEVKQKYLPLVSECEEQIRGIYKKHRDEYFKEEGYGEHIALENPASFFDYMMQHVTEGEKETISNAVITMEELLREMRGEFYINAVSSISFEQANLVGYIESLGGQVKAQYVTFNALSANIALKHVRQIADRPEVARVLKDRLLSMSLDVSADAIDAETWWNDGYTGGAWDIGVVDSGVDDAHPALSGHRFFETSFADRDQDGIVDEDEDDYLGHGTHVAGIVASTDSTYRGVAYGLDSVVNAKFGCSWGDIHWSDAMEAIDWALFTAGDDADVINFSAGGSPGAGDTDFARFFDAVVDDAYCPVAVAAGNRYDVEDPGVAYNILSVAASDDHDTIARGDDTLRANSGRGPTGDGRAKPDITAPGDAIMSCNNDWESESDFIGKSGTSMAAPHIAGACLLLLDYGISNPLAMKALLINTAEKMGFTGWDSGWGWGYVDLSHAHFHRTDTFTATIDDVEGDDYAFYKGHMYSGDLVTLVWNRHVDYNGPNYPTTWYDCSDIDLQLWDESTNSIIAWPFSVVDNVEQATVTTERDVIVKAEAWGSFAPGIDTENIALATEENFQSVSPPSFTVSMNNPGFVPVGQTFTVSATVTNNGDIAAHDVEVTLNLPTGLTLVSGSNPQDIGDINPGSWNIASWVVEATSAGDYTMTTSVESYSYYEWFTGDGSTSIQALEWFIETVDSTGDVGGYSSIDLDSFDNPHISYYDNDFYALRYVRFDGTGWSPRERADPSSDVGHWTSLALDSDDNPHISYYDFGNDYLKYTKRIGTDWFPETVDSTDRWVGWCTSVALDSGDRPYISYFDAYYYDLKYVRWTGTAWSTPERVDSAGTVGLYTSIAVEPEGVHVSYYDDTNGDLKYALRTKPGWSVGTLDSAGTVGLWTSLALDSFDNPHISYYDSTNGDLKYARLTGLGWRFQTVDSAGDVGLYTSIALDSDNYAHISYYDNTHGDLKYARWDGTQWIIGTLDSAGTVGLWTSLALDSFDNPHISYYDATNTNLKYATTLPPNLSPVADANGPYPGTEGVTLTFDGSGSYDPDGTIISYEWDFGDGDTGTGVNPTHTYAQEGTYPVTLTVTDNRGVPETDTATATISDTEPNADFSGTPTSGPEPLIVDFTDLSTSYDGIIDWQWDFNNDGIVDSTAQNPTHVYDQDGVYTVTLKVYEADGDSDVETKIDYIVVSDTDPVADFSTYPRSGHPPLTVSFTDLSTSYDGIVSWLWDFGDGETSTEQNPTHTYTDIDTYTVSLTVYEADGDSDTETKVNYIIVKTGIINVMFEEAHYSLFTIGSNPAASVTGGYSEFAYQLTANGYFVSTIDPGTTIDSTVLAPVDVLVIVAPQIGYSTLEIDAIETWVNAGGTLLLLTDWDNFGTQASTIAARFGITLPFDVILDSDENAGSTAWPYYDGANLLVHPVTDGVTRVEMYAGDGITSAPADEIPLIVTDSDGTATWYYAGTPALGVSVMSAIDRGGTAGSGRLIVITDSDLWNSVSDLDGDGYINFYDSDNEILALNAIDWLAAVIHDVAVTDVTPSKTVVGQGYSVSIDVTVENQGQWTETFDVTVYYGTDTLTPEQWKSFWSMGDVNRDGYIDGTDVDSLTAAFGSYPGHPNWNPQADLNQDLIIDVLDAGILSSNYGLDIFTHFISGGAIQTITVVNLPNGMFTTLTFTWDTTGVSYDNYIISAYATPVPGEIYTTNNNLANGEVLVTIPGDVDGNGHVDLDDLYYVLITYGAKEGDPDYDPNIDIDGDGEIDLDDLYEVLWSYGT